MEISASFKADQPFYAIIVAGGSGTRLGDTLPKQYQTLGSKTILERTLDRFIQCENLVDICVVIADDHAALFEQYCGAYDVTITKGGLTRKESVNNGLSCFSNLKKEDVILIHDAARPFVAHDDIQKIVHTAHEKGAATLGIPVTDTLKYDGGDYVKRDNLWALQTPQGFHYGLIQQAHNRGTDIATDDTALVAATGHNISFVEGHVNNFKITTQEDFDRARKMISEQYETRTGTGFDVHAFDSNSQGPIRLCGIDIPHDTRLKGHSDADVALHTITDALLGALGAGDIGMHFPPSDEQWKGKDSAFFLKHALNFLKERGGNIINIDLTIICEAPKIGQYRNQMVQRISEICDTKPSRINVKGTTTEKLGFTGRGEGIAAQASVSISLPSEDNLL